MNHDDRNLIIENSLWQAELTSHGGQLLRARHRDFPQEVIFLGKRAEFAPGKAIRGGSPVCWPWFGASSVPGRPAQGFARTAEWDIENSENAFVRFRLPENRIPGSLRDFPFELRSEIRLSDALELALVMKNCGETPAEISCALHTYLAVSDCEKVTVSGLENAPYTVKGGPEEPPAREPLKIEGEVCRLYFPQSGEIVLTDPGWGRQIFIGKRNSNSTLVWNPGPERCAQISDLEDTEYKNFLCIEANRAGGDTLLLPPGAELRLEQHIRLRPL
ncbi:MAG: D-hexose-6-phosphate mutarotase [Lentisphaeria bacterium]|nr:D-hexose-6-phosphate mutarotase [Lentisphaeria bacterium]